MMNEAAEKENQKESQKESRKENFYTGYEYHEIFVPGQLASLCLDSYPCFGWKADDNPAQGKGGKGRAGYVELRFKRDRKITNKMELTRLQRNFDSCLEQLESLEKSKTSSPTVAALITGLIGTAFMALSTFAVTAEPPRVLLCILFAVPGFIGWILPVFLYRRLVFDKKKKLEPLIEQKYDEIYELCEKGNHLLF